MTHKLLITVNGKSYEVELEVLDYNTEAAEPRYESVPAPAPAVAAPAPAPAPMQMPAPAPAPQRKMGRPVGSRNIARPATPAPSATPARRPGRPPKARPDAAPAGAPSAGGEVTAHLNGVVIEIPVTVGQAVKAGDTVMVLEAMKMKNYVNAPADGVVASIEVKINDNVEAGQVLLRMA